MNEFPTTEIDGVEYQFAPLGAKLARKNLLKLVKTFGPAISGVTEGLGDMAKIENFSLDNTEAVELLQSGAKSISGGIDRLLPQLDEKTYEHMVDTFVGRISRKDEEGLQRLVEGIRNELFARQLYLELRLLAWALKEQYSDFFEPLRKVAGSATRMAILNQSRLNSRKESIGSSGGSSPQSA